MGDSNEVRRYIFDHLPKTAGSAVTTFLRAALGQYRVTPHLIEEHTELIARYGHYDVICAHVLFNPGATLDPRYSYLTILREPLDRALSWLYFAAGDVQETNANRIEVEAARKFLNTEGEFFTPILEQQLRDPHTFHFLQLDPSATKNLPVASKVDRALEVLSRYRLIGLYHSLPSFVDELRELLCLAEKSLPVVNKTTNRPRIDDISTKLRTRLEDLTAVDSELFRAAKRLVEERKCNKRRHSDIDLGSETHGFLGWGASVPERAVEIISGSVANASGGANLYFGDLARFEFTLKLRLPVRSLLIGIHMFEDSGRKIFGTNNDLLGSEYRDIDANVIKLRFNIRLNLAAGRYVAGIALLDSYSGYKLLGWWDRVVDFEVSKSALDFVGITRLETSIEVETLQ
jgi:Wzt C-terminal domain